MINIELTEAEWEILCEHKDSILEWYMASDEQEVAESLEEKIRTAYMKSKGLL